MGLATLVIAAGSFFFQLPEPKAAIIIDHGKLHIDSADVRDITLPLLRVPDLPPGAIPWFTARFTLPAAPQNDLFLLVSGLNRHLKMTLNGQLLFDSRATTMAVGPVIGAPALVLLPHSLLVEGRNELSLILGSGNFFFSINIPKVYIGNDAALVPAFNLRLLLDERLKTMSLAAHVLLALGLVFAHLYRPKDHLLSWMAGLLTFGFGVSVCLFFGFNSSLYGILPYATAALPTIGLLGVGVACCVAGLPPPKVAVVLAVGVPLGCLLLILAGIMPSHKAPANIAASLFLAAFAVGTGITAWGAFCRGMTDARLMLPSYFLFVVFVLRDILLGLGFIARDVIAVTPYIRPFFLISVLAVLMRRLVTSLDGLDRANENLTRRLEEQEAQLAALHRTEQIEATQLAREQERLRLTYDLHDGISGHLVSIIAMTEGSGADGEPVEQAARRALDDLRLVIYSLDLGDQDLPLALANFRERLTPQLQRAGVELDWSTAGLPEVSGVTPSNALSILRILQEALTNALKHGPARMIAVRGAPAEDRMAAISIDNDGCPFEERQHGLGLANMRRRAMELNGEIRIVALDAGTRLTLLLPTCLPNMREAASGAPPLGSPRPITGTALAR